ncbi:MAG: hypothetical protein C0611_03970 [Desulfobacteraceae bacterium]|nr:MAG: hypothetical protein C0611_03970 [Desulfobacteraceae bacterium]
MIQINPEALVLNIRNKISGRLKNRGLAPIEITRLIKDVYNIIGSEWYFTTADVKYALERLGWERYLLDNYTLELIFLYLDDQALVGLNRHVVH